MLNIFYGPRRLLMLKSQNAESVKFIHMNVLMYEYEYDYNLVAVLSSV
jgi:hypothetical protein